jgi:hypothetical protein
MKNSNRNETKHPLCPTFNVCGQPFETLVETITGRGAGSLGIEYVNTWRKQLKLRTDLDVPGSLPETMQTKFIRDFSSVHGIGQILLVCENKQKSVTQLIFVEHSLKFLTCFRHTFPIIGVDNKNNTLSVLEVYV